jgi:hypothetical protein
VSFVAITLCVASQRVFIVVSVYFVIDSVRKLLDTPSYNRGGGGGGGLSKRPNVKHVLENLTCDWPSLWLFNTFPTFTM